MATRRIISNEDGALNRASVSTSQSRTHIDVDLAFQAKPGDGNIGDVYKKFDVGAILQSVKTIVLTSPGEKPFLPSFGVGADDFLFELNDNSSKSDLRDRIISNIQRFEPRVEVQQLRIEGDVDTNTLAAVIEMRVLSTGDVVTFTSYFNRLR